MHYLSTILIYLRHPQEDLSVSWLNIVIISGYSNDIGKQRLKTFIRQPLGRNPLGKSLVIHCILCVLYI